MSKQIFISSGGEDIAKITHYPDTGRVEVRSNLMSRYHNRADLDAQEFANLIAELELPEPLSERDLGIRLLQKANEEAGWGFMDTDERYWGDLYDQGVRAVKP